MAITSQYTDVLLAMYVVTAPPMANPGTPEKYPHPRTTERLDVLESV
jgi:hypothetical protein